MCLYSIPQANPALHWVQFGGSGRLIETLSTTPTN